MTIITMETTQTNISPLQDPRTIILFRSPKSGQDPYIKAIQSAGHLAKCIPVLGFNFVNLADLHNCLTQKNLGGIILTSPRAVESVSQALDRLENRNDVMSMWQDKHAFVVGEATSKAAENLGFNTIGANSGNAEALVPIIIEKIGSNTSQSLLFPCSNLRRETIPSRLAEVNIPFHSITTYETGPAVDIKGKLVENVPHKQPDYLVFFSPSGVDYTWPILKELHYDISSIKCVAIGPTTEKALETKGVQPAATAASPTPEHLVTAILDTL